MTRQRARSLAAGALVLLTGCNAPDYTPVRDWARAGSLVADHPGATRAVAALPPDAAPAEVRDGIVAMQAALSLHLAALGRMADDGVLQYPEDPFTDLAARAAGADAAGGEAVAGLGRFLRYATRGNLRAPQLRDSIRATDPLVQELARALVASIRREATAMPGEAGPLEAYAAVVAQIGEGHALLKARASDITDEEVVQLIRAEEDRLRRAARALPYPAAAPAPAAAR
ncbi:hypothetical protein GXW74_22665 [Roseomonas eburnea]|uniref:Uncharacterized protein n=1 Tax=Neoroseomonas eburnea TaxID=1346889 RepID=A0A9X9XHX0_9PROT|nr:hypothetical protein [Neoroseomonas eburnea]MBR0683306.1 hypothetical protein [Neoroseomonas eburnea]